MAKNETRRINHGLLAADEETYISIQALENYQPFQTAVGKQALTICHEALRAAHEAEVRAENAAAAARDNAAQAEWEFHDLILAAKAQVVAQYGDDSNEVQSLGLKKKSEYKAPARRKAKAAS